MFELASLILRLFADASDPLEWHEPEFCDDGSSPWRRDGRPNFDCHVGGCSSRGPVCFADRLAHCHDVAGADTGACELETDECHSKLACFDMWLYCAGVYKCHDATSWVGCNHGSCTTDTAPVAPDDLLVAEEFSAAWSTSEDP